MKHSIYKYLILFFILLLSSHFAVADEIKLLHSPCENSVVTNRRPDISLSTSHIKIVPASITVKINDTMITGYHFLLGSITLKPRENLPLGKNTVLIRFKDQEGKNHSYQWSFRVEEKDLIKNVTHNYKAPLMTKERLVVEVEGRSGGECFFSIGGIISNVKMEETEHGFYTGFYEAKEYDIVTDEVLSVTLTMPDSSSQTVEAEDRVSIMSHMFRVRIISPADEEKVAQHFLLRGRTKPNVKVFITLEMSFKYFNNIINTSGPESGGIETLSDSEGIFEKVIGFPINMDGLSSKIKIYARDDRGYTSLEDEITVYLISKKL